MKSIWIAFLSVMYMLGSILCINQSPDTTSNEEVSIQPTGYPDGELQWTYIFWEGNLYSNDAIFVKTLPEDAYQIGEIEKEDNINYPDENLEASHIDVGVEVYSDTRYLYIKAGTDSYRRFSISTDAN